MSTTEPNPLTASTVYPAIRQLLEDLEHLILGQRQLLQRMLIALLADGHLLVQGAPGLAKTRAVKLLADHIEGDFQRLQFTPDLLPADLTGSEIYKRDESNFVFQPGPLFHHFLLADEINRAPAKVQSALLEAMAERQISVGCHTYSLPELFLVMATQNPIEQEGTYPLPEAQMDRFLMQVNIDYPNAEDERAILQLARNESAKGMMSIKPISQVSQQTIFKARQEVLKIFVAPEVEAYMVRLVHCTRNPGRLLSDFDRWIRFGASPRGSIALDKCARAHAWLEGRQFVTPLDVQDIAKDALRHRLILSFDAEASGMSADEYIQALLEKLPAP